MDLITFKEILKEILLVGVPETLITLLLGIVLIRGRNFYRKIDTVKRKAIFFVKLSISIVAILSLINLARHGIQNILVVAIISLAVYISTFKFLFDMNIRKSLVAGSFAVLTICFAEIFAIPFFNTITNNVYFDSKATLAIIPRFIQLAMLLLLSVSNLSLKNIKILSDKWSNVKSGEKFNLIFVIILIVLCIIFNASYSDLYVNLSGLKTESISLKVSLGIYLFENLLFLLVTFFLLNNVKLRYEYQRVLERGDKELLQDLLDIADVNTIKDYIKIADLYIQEKEKEKGVSNNAE